MRVKPVFDIRARLERVTHHARRSQIRVAERLSEQDHPRPTVHSLAGGFLVVAIGKAIAIREAVAAPDVERAEARKARVLAVVVRVVLRDEPRHFAIARREIRLELREQARRIDEVALMKMRVGKMLGAIRGGEADERLAPRIVGEKLALLARREGEPVLHRAAQFAGDGIERGILRLRRDECRLRVFLDLLAAPIRVAAELLRRVGEMLRQQLAHPRAVKALRRRRGQIRQDASERIREREGVARGAFHRPANRRVGRPVELQRRGVLTPVMRQKSLNHVLARAGFQRLRDDFPSRRDAPRIAVVVPRELRIARHREGVLVEKRYVLFRRHRTHDEECRLPRKRHRDARVRLLKLRPVRREHAPASPLVADAQRIARRRQRRRRAREIEKRRRLFPA